MSNPNSTNRYAEDKGQRYRLMTLPDFRNFRDFAVSVDSTWVTHYSDKVLKVESRPSGDPTVTLNIIRAERIMEYVQPQVLYNQLHDAKYRETWDVDMLEGRNIVQLDSHNDIGYYAVKLMWPLTNRDFCNMRSWMEFENEEYIIFNHSEPHPDCPLKSNFVRGKSILSGFYMRPNPKGKGTLLTYITHSDPGGSIPHSLINYVMKKGAPMILNKCEKSSEEYPNFVKATYPPGYIFPWKTPKMSWDSPFAYPEECEGNTKDGGGNAVEASGAEGVSSDELHAANTVSAFLEAKPPTSRPPVSLAPVAPYCTTDLLCVQQYRSILQDSINYVDRSFMREDRVPSTKEYLLRLKHIIEGIRQTTAAI